MGNDGFDASGQKTDDDRPAHRVTLSDFYLQETEVTNREMDAYFVERKRIGTSGRRGFRKPGT